MPANLRWFAWCHFVKYYYSDILQFQLILNFDKTMKLGWLTFLAQSVGTICTSSMLQTAEYYMSIDYLFVLWRHFPERRVCL